MSTPKLSLAEIANSQANKYITHNNALRDLDVLVQGAVISATITAQPGSPSDGDTYLIPQGSPSATGAAWAGNEGKIAFYRSSEWRFLTPQEGWAFWEESTDTVWRYDGTSWAIEASGGSSLTITSDDSPSPDGTFTQINFTGAGVNVTDLGGNTCQVNIPSGAALTIQSDDSPTVDGEFTTLIFNGAGVNVTDSGSNTATIDIGSSASITVSSDDSPTPDGSFTELNFTGAGVNVTDLGSGVANISITATGGSGVTVTSDDSPTVNDSFTELNFTGAGVNVTDAGGGVANIEISSSGGGGGSFSGAAAYQNTAQSLTTATWTSIQFDAERFDTGGFIDLGTNNTRITVSEAGYYLVQGTGSFATNASGDRRGLRIRKNGTDRLKIINHAFTTLTQPVINTGEVFYLAANDYVELQLIHDVGSSINTASDIDTSTQCELQVIRVDLGAGGSITVSSSDSSPAVDGSFSEINFSGLTVEDAGGGVVNVTGSSASSSAAVIQDEKATPTAGGTFTSGSYATRDLNTIAQDPDGIVTSLTSNEFTLEAGTYLISWRAPAYKVDAHKSRLYDVTGAVAVDYGVNAFASATDTTDSYSHGSVVVSPTSSNAYRIEHQCGTTVATVGYGQAGGLTIEIYTQVTILKIA